jgi:hypothetical protein
MSNVDDILAERGQRYGPFRTHAQITQDLKDVMHDVKGWGDLPQDVKESLEMIQHKIARILNGQHGYKDSWDDIQGYAKLVGDTLEGL